MDVDIAEKKNYNPPTIIAITIFIYFVAQIIAVIVFYIVANFMNISEDQTSSWIQDNVWTTFGFVLLVEVITLYLVYIFLKFKKLNFKHLGLNKIKVKYIGYALGGFVMYFLLYLIGIVIAKLLVPDLNLDQKQEIGFETSTSGLSLVPVFFSLVILPPITEEIVARGFLFGGLRTKLPFVVSAIVTSILFAAAHLGAATEGLLWIAAIDTFILSMVLCHLREKTGSLWPSIGVHALKNGLAFVILFDIVQYFK